MRLQGSAIHGTGYSSRVLASGINTDLIRDGENGFLADGADQWIMKLTLLFGHPAVRRKLRLGRAQNNF